MAEPSTIISSLESADKNISLAINALNSPFSDTVWQIFSNRWVWIPLYLAVVVYFVWAFGWRKALILTLSCVLTILACDQFANLFKGLFQRLRPCWDEYMTSFESFNLLESKGSKFGFFSAHAANALGFAVCSLRPIRRNKTKAYKLITWILLSWALLVGISRVFAGKHFLGDILVGFAFGALIAWCISFLSEKIIK